jgi:hypothetical protein
VTAQGRPLTRFRRALATGDLLLIRAAAAEVPRVNLSDALRICVVLQRAEPASYERAAVRWLARFCLEVDGVTVKDVRSAAGVFEQLPDDPEAARAELERLCGSRP